MVINSNGQLGVQPVITSSRRYKEDIQDMGDVSTGLLRLRPVTFHYKKPAPDGSKPIEFGLIAEEVDTVYPDLVVRGPDGQIDSVQYSKLPAMLLNELQKQYHHAEQQDYAPSSRTTRFTSSKLVSPRWKHNWPTRRRGLIPTPLAHSRCDRAKILGGAKKKQLGPCRFFSVAPNCGGAACGVSGTAQTLAESCTRHLHPA